MKLTIFLLMLLLVAPAIALDSGWYDNPQSSGPSIASGGRSNVAGQHMQYRDASDNYYDVDVLSENNAELHIKESDGDEWIVPKGAIVRYRTTGVIGSQPPQSPGFDAVDGGMAMLGIVGLALFLSRRGV